MKTKVALELKVGTFILVGLIFLGVITFGIGDFYLLKHGYYINTEFSFANGIEIGAPVRLAGVKVGEVRDIDIFYDETLDKTRIRLKLWLESDVRVPRDSQAHINSLGLLGEKYLEIYPGADYTSYLKGDETLPGCDPLSMERITELGHRVVLKLDRTIDSVNEVVQDQELKGSLKEAISDLRVLLASTNSLLESVKSGKGTLGKLFTDDSLFLELEEFIQDIKKNPWKLLHRPRTRKRDKEK
jgi:phospholipid/cholesterol/gamma-HCH transport system substrate-binding protein